MVTAASWLALLFALEAAAPRLASLAETRSTHAGEVLVLSDQARRLLLLQYQAYPTEFLGCMVGEVHGNAVVVQRIAPADVDPAASRATHVVPKTTCEGAGWPHTVGVIHSHPGAQKCWYYFPGTEVATSDQQSFLHQPYPVDAIMCGNAVVWIDRDRRERRMEIAAPGLP
jgi:hypothetical protein